MRKLSPDFRVARRRQFSSAYKRRIVREAADLLDGSGDVGALFRREGLYSSHLTTWRREIGAAQTQALALQQRGPKAGVAKAEAGSELRFEIDRVPRDGHSMEAERATLKLIVGPGDHAEPVMIILLPNED
jgi:transposase-like protein